MRDSRGVYVSIQSVVVCHTVRVNNALALSAHPAEVHGEIQAFAEVVLPGIVLEYILRITSDWEVRAHPVCIVDSHKLILQRDWNLVKRSEDGCEVLKTGHCIVPCILVALGSDFVRIELWNNVVAQVRDFVGWVMVVSNHYEREELSRIKKLTFVLFS